MTTPTILVIDDRQEIIVSAQFVLEDNGFSVFSARSPYDAKDIIHQQKIDVILLDMNYSLDTTSGEEGLEFLSWLSKNKVDAAIVAMTAWSNVELAVKAMQLGAGDFIEKPWKNQRLLQVINHQLELTGLKKQNQKLEQRLETAPSSPPYQWRSPCMQDLMTQLESVALADVSILLTGENGTGKSQMAEFLHQHSNRASSPFIAVNMGAISETLFESEMFGHVKGAFTDAKSDRMGRFELAKGGTLFLDEIANIPLSQQAKLLRVLESGDFEAVGSSQTQRTDVRIISATNADCQQLIQKETFRQDLFYRLNTIEFELPALRERTLDIVPLAEHLLVKFTKKYKKSDMTLGADAKQRLLSYHWPGNIRELSHIIERATLLSQSSSISAAGLNISGASQATELLGVMTLEQAEKTLVKNALTMAEGNITQAAKLLGITKSSLYRRLEKYEDIHK